MASGLPATTSSVAVGAVGDQVGAVGEVLDQGAQDAHHRVTLPQGGVAQIDALVVAPTEGGECLGRLLFHPDLPRAERGRDDAGDEGTKLGAATLPAQRAHRRWQLVGGDDAGQHRVLPVMAHVRDPVGPAHDLAFGCRGRRTGPAVVGDPVERLGTEIEWGERDAGAPGGVVEPPGYVGVERVFTGMTAGPVPAVVAERDGLCERDVEAARARDRSRDLCHLERVREAGALVILGEHEDLRLAGEAPKRRGVQDAVPVALEARSPRVGLFGHGSPSRVTGAGSPRRQELLFERLSLLAADRQGGAPGSRPAAGSTVPSPAWESAWARRTGPA